MIDHFQDLVLFQRSLTLIEESSYEDTLDLILKSDYLNSANQISFLTHEIFQAYTVRPQNIGLLTKLVKDIINSDESKKKLTPFKAIFIEQTLSGVDDNNKSGLCAAYHFMYRLLEENTLTLDELLPIFDAVLQKPKEKVNTIAIIKIFFGSAIEKSHPTLYLRIFSGERSHQRANDNKDQSNTGVNDNIDHSTKNSCFSYFNEFVQYPNEIKDQLIHYGHPLDSVQHAIATDDLEKLIQFSLLPKFDFDMKLRHANVLMEPYPVLQGDATLILYAAYCNSINCFKWLFLNGSNINAKDKWGQDAAYFAISGGSLEILRILEQQGFDVHNLEPCIEHRQYHIFDWIIEQNLDENGRYPQELINNAYIFSARYNNAYTLCECIKYGANPMAHLQLWGAMHQSILYSDLQMAILLAQCSEIDVNWKDANGCSALLFATTNHCYKVVQALIENPRVDINTFDNNQWTCLHRLVSDRATEMIKLICSVKGFDVNFRDINGRSAYDIAASMHYQEAMDIISKTPGFKD